MLEIEIEIDTIDMIEVDIHTWYRKYPLFHSESEKRTLLVLSLLKNSKR